MGAAASIEGAKPADASDIRAEGTLDAARREVIRLRTELGDLAKQHPGFETIIVDASDLCKGEHEDEDMERCISEVVHIRAALRLSTQSSRRQTRAVMNNSVFGFGTEMGAAAAMGAAAFNSRARPNIDMDFATDSGSSSSDDESGGNNDDGPDAA